MDMLGMLFKLVVMLPIMILCIYFLGKLHSATASGGRNMKVIERVFLSKENSLSLVKIGDDYFVISSSQGKVEILKQVEASEVQLNGGKMEKQLLKDTLGKFMSKGERYD